MAHQMYSLILQCCSFLILCKPVYTNIIKKTLQKLWPNNNITSSPRAHTFSTMERALLLLHRPWLKPPHVPRGVPKLAKLILDITWSGWGQPRDRVGPALFLVSSSAVHISTGIGCDSETREHMLCVSLVAKDSCVGSPPASSNNTTTFPLGCSHERGTW